MKKNFSKPVTRCQISNSKNLESLLFLGFLPPVNTLRKIGSILNEEITFVKKAKGLKTSLGG